MSNPSPIFQEVFNSHAGSVRRTCACGVTHFNYADPGCFETGELEALMKRSKTYPSRYRACDHTIGWMTIDEMDIVYDCGCGYAARHEEFILRHAEQLAEYLRRRAGLLREKADKIDPSKAVPQEGIAKEDGI